MNRILIAPLLLLTIGAIAQGRPKPQRRDLKVLSNEGGVVYFKVDKSYVGGWVEIFDENNACLEADSIPHTHTMVYFDQMPTGRYKVKVKKGRKSAEFSYDNI